MNEVQQRVSDLMQHNAEEAFSETFFTNDAGEDGAAMTLDKIQEAQRKLEGFKPQLYVDLMESSVLQIVDYVPRTWRERLLSWPWRPRQAKRREYLPDPNIYRFDGPAGIEVWVCHPGTAERVRQLARENGVQL